MSVLHIHEQEGNHEEAWIVGNRESLTALRDALTRAIDSDQPQSCISFASDGEGYHVLILRVEDQKVWDTLRPPYCDPYGVDDGEVPSVPRHPCHIISDEDYTRLMRSK